MIKPISYPRYYSNQDESRMLCFKKPNHVVIIRYSKGIAGAEFMSVQRAIVRDVFEKNAHNELIEIEANIFYACLNNIFISQGEITNLNFSS